LAIACPPRSLNHLMHHSLVWIGEYIQAFRLQYPVQNDFGRKSSRWFLVIAPIVGVVLILLAFAGQAYEPVALYSRSFNSTTGSLWYERLLGSATSSFGLPSGWSCAGSIIEIGDGSLHRSAAKSRMGHNKRVPKISTCILRR
jgi:hypothetical protein